MSIYSASFGRQRATGDSDRNFVTLKLTTDDRLIGLGDATLNGREQAVVAYLAEHVVPLLIGRDASRIEDTWQFLYRWGRHTSEHQGSTRTARRSGRTPEPRFSRSARSNRE